MNEQGGITLTPDWQDKYRSMIASPKEAVSRIMPGHRVFIGTGCAQPQELVRALTSRSSELAEHFRVNSFFIAENVRDIIQEGLGDYTPIFLSDIPRLFSSGQLPLDAALIQVTPPDSTGLCSLGISVDIVKSAAENAALVIAQVNPQMPRTMGDSFLHVHDLDILVPVNEPLFEVKQAEPTEVTRRIGEYIAALIEDGCTVEFGIGRISQAVLEFLRDKKDLGIHTEMFSDAIIDLVESGVITGKRKSIDRGKIVASFCMGSRRLYDYIDNNPIFSFHPTEYVNDLFIIGQQHKMVAINVALEIDLTGQVCSDSLGTKFFSGIGGQVDFNRGAARSPGGKAIIALPSTARSGAVSRIVAHLSSGAGVVTTRGDVHYVVTEYGVAYLHGKSVQDRALALISIAHPDFRANLLKEAIKAKYIRPELADELADTEGHILLGAQELRTSLLLEDGTQINFRPIHPTDESRIRDLFYGLSQQATYYRYMAHMKRIPQKQMQDFVYIGRRNDVALVGTVPAAHGEEIIAIGRYYLNSRTNRAELALLVRDEWQNRGIGTFLLRYLVTIARRNGVGGFTAEILRQNRAAQALLHKSGLKMRSSLNEGVYSFDLDLT